MKKILALVLMFAVLALPVTPAIAKDLDDDEIEIGRNSIYVKAGYAFSQGAAAGINKRRVDHFDLENNYVLSIGYLYYNNYDSSGIGFAFDYIPATEVKKSNGDVKVGFYNIYGTINPTLKDNIANTFSLYLPIHIGLSIPYKDVKDTITDDISFGDMGFYCGIGLGTTIKKSFIIELMYTFSGAFINKDKSSNKDDTSFFGTNYGGVRLNVGYQFHFGKKVSNKGRFEGKE
ncbi:MAG: hypothetical protein II816_05475 [Elusimicrobia bacterium]|nr:hypothetical protein [Elusimicrobiota bacterium]